MATDQLESLLSEDIQNHQSMAPDLEHASKTASQSKILIVEDEPELASLLERYLRNHGIATAIAADGLSACRMINALRPDLILLDVMLPELDGWEVCRLVRKIPDRDLADIPIIMLSALHAADNRAQGLKLGANDYISKPYSLKEVLQRSMQLIAKQQAKSAH